MSRSAAVSAATQWKITNMFTFQQENGCGLLTTFLSRLLRVRSLCAKQLVLHTSGHSTTLTSTYDGQPTDVTTTTIASSASYAPQHPRFLTFPDTHLVHDTTTFSSHRASTPAPTHLRGGLPPSAPSHHTLVFLPDVAAIYTTDPPATTAATPIADDPSDAIQASALQQAFPHLGISSKAAAEILDLNKALASLPSSAQMVYAPVSADTLESSLEKVPALEAEQQATAGATEPLATAITSESTATDDTASAPLEEDAAALPAATSSSDAESAADPAAAAALLALLPAHESAPSVAHPAASQQDVSSFDQGVSTDHSFDSSDVLVPS